MGLYASLVLPRLLNLAMQTAAIEHERRRLIPLAKGRVVEIGVGSGLNLPFYGPDVDRLDAVDPSRALWALGADRAARVPFPVHFTLATAEALPFDDAIFDTAVITWTLCSIQEPVRAVREVRRVLRPDGRLICVEHGRAPEASVRTWQARITPWWKRLAGGCELGRDIAELIRAGGFQFTKLEKAYSEGPRPFVYLYKGVAEPSATLPPA